MRAVWRACPRGPPSPQEQTACAQAPRRNMWLNWCRSGALCAPYESIIFRLDRSGLALVGGLFLGFGLIAIGAEKHDQRRPSGPDRGNGPRELHEPITLRASWANVAHAATFKSCAWPSQFRESTEVTRRRIRLRVARMHRAIDRNPGPLPGFLADPHKLRIGPYGDDLTGPLWTLAPNPPARAAAARPIPAGFRPALERRRNARLRGRSPRCGDRRNP